MTEAERETIQSYLEDLIDQQPDNPSWSEIARRVHTAGFRIHETTLRSAVRTTGPSAKPPSAKTLRAFATVLKGANLRHMLILAGHLDETAIDDLLLMPSAIELATILATLPPADQTLIETMIRRLDAAQRATGEQEPAQ